MIVNLNITVFKVSLPLHPKHGDLSSMNRNFSTTHLQKTSSPRNVSLSSRLKTKILNRSSFQFDTFDL